MKRAASGGRSLGLYSRTASWEAAWFESRLVHMGEEEYSVPLEGRSYSYVSCDCGNLMTEKYANKYGQCSECHERETKPLGVRIYEGLYQH